MERKVVGKKGEKRYRRGEESGGDKNCVERIGKIGRIGWEGRK